MKNTFDCLSYINLYNSVVFISQAVFGSLYVQHQLLGIQLNLTKQFTNSNLNPLQIN